MRYPKSVRIMSNADESQIYFMGRSTVLKERETGTTIERINGLGNSTGVLSPDGRYAAFSHGDGNLKVMETTITHRECFRDKHKKADYAMAFTPDGKKLLVSNLDRTVYSYEIPGGKKEKFYEFPELHFCMDITVAGDIMAIFAHDIAGSKEPSQILIHHFSTGEQKVYTLPDDNWHTAILLDETHIGVFKTIGWMDLYALSLLGDWENPKHSMSLPNLWFPRFSPDGRYLSIVAYIPCDNTLGQREEA